MASPKKMMAKNAYKRYCKTCAIKRFWGEAGYSSPVTKTSGAY